MSVTFHCEAENQNQLKYLVKGHRQVKRDVNLSIERLKGMIYRIAVTIYQ
ncbi:MAG: hypothetical protein RCO49_00480 [Rickettsia endosymbiont of Argas persicus]